MLTLPTNRNEISALNSFGKAAYLIFDIDCAIKNYVKYIRR